MDGGSRNAVLPQLFVELLQPGEIVVEMRVVGEATPQCRMHAAVEVDRSGASRRYILERGEPPRNELEVAANTRRRRGMAPAQVGCRHCRAVKRLRDEGGTAVEVDRVYNDRDR